MRRNALVVLGNIGEPSDPDVVTAVRTYIGDPDPMLRAHAVWTARRLGLSALLDAADDDPLVAAERTGPVAPRALAVTV